MNILILHKVQFPLDGGKWDGSSTHRYEIVKGLSESNQKVYIVSTNQMSGTLPNVSIFPVVGSHYLIKIVLYCLISFKIVANCRIDVIYSRNPVFSFWGICLSKLFNIPLLFEINGIFEEESKSFQHVSLPKIKLIQFIKNIVEKKATLIRAVTPEIKDHLISKGIDRNRIFVLRNGVDIQSFRPLDSSITTNDQPFVICHIGSFYSWQGIELLPEIILHLKKLPIPKFIFILIGDGPERNKIIRMVDDAHVQEYVEFLGQIQYNKIPQYINNSDVCILFKKPLISGYSPLKLYEYLACGKPVVAPDLSGFEILHDFKCGIVIPDREAHQYAKELLYLSQNPEIISEMGSNGRDFVVNNASWDSICEDLMNHVNKII